MIGMKKRISLHRNLIEKDSRLFEGSHRKFKMQSDTYTEAAVQIPLDYC